MNMRAGSHDTTTLRGIHLTESISALDVDTTIDSEPRIRDLRLAQVLGMANIHAIRRIIDRHAVTLRDFGRLVSHPDAKTGPGRPSSSYWLNRRQALYVTAKSETEAAALVAVRMVEVFDAFLAGIPLRCAPITAAFHWLPIPAGTTPILDLPGLPARPAITSEFGDGVRVAAPLLTMLFKTKTDFSIETAALTHGAAIRKAGAVPTIPRSRSEPNRPRDVAFLNEEQAKIALRNSSQRNMRRILDCIAQADRAREAPASADDTRRLAEAILESNRRGGTAQHTIDQIERALTSRPVASDEDAATRLLMAVDEIRNGDIGEHSVAARRVLAVAQFLASAGHHMPVIERYYTA